MEELYGGLPACVSRPFLGASASGMLQDTFQLLQCFSASQRQASCWCVQIPSRAAPAPPRFRNLEFLEGQLDRYNAQQEAQAEEADRSGIALAVLGGRGLGQLQRGLPELARALLNALAGWQRAG